MMSFIFIARDTSRMISRSILFRGTAPLFCGLVWFLQLHVQGNVLSYGSFTRTSLASDIPYLNVFLLSLFLLVPLAFIAPGALGAAGDRFRAREVFYARPESNVDYILGVCWGILRVFLVVGAVSLVGAAFIHLFGSQAPFSGRPYFFFFFLSWFPTLVFVVGFSLFAGSVIRHQAGAILSSMLLLAACYLSIFRGNEVIDPLGVNLPGAFSDVTGLAGWGDYLVQRGGWFLVGVGLACHAAALFRRIPNRPRSRGRLALFGALLVVAGMACCANPALSRHATGRARAAYATTYERYNDRGKLTLLNEDIACTREGDQLRASARMIRQNQTTRAIEEPVIYLNPALQVTGLTVNGSATPFQREHQVITFLAPASPGDSLVVNVEYAGGVDENVCYLDVPEATLHEKRRDPYSACLPGQKFAFMERDFTLLIPECLWYPVAIPPVNPASAYDLQKNFTRYTLKVVAPGDLTVISQGERSRLGDTLLFRDDSPSSGLSLCIGPYARFALSTGRGERELYIFKGHESILDGLEILRDTLPHLLDGWIGSMEGSFGTDYPFRYLLGVETPASFTSYYRHQRGGSEFVQPGLLFLPERLHSLSFAHFAGGQLWARQALERFGEADQDELMIATSLFRPFMEMNFTEEYRTQTSPLDRFTGQESWRERALNPYNASAWFFNHVYHVYSPEYPAMNMIFQRLIRHEAGVETLNAMNVEYAQDAIDYMEHHGLREALFDRGLSPHVLYEILRLKSRDFKGRLLARGVPGETLKRHMLDYARAHPFQRLDFDDFNSDFTARHGVDWRTVWPEWYAIDRLPAFFVTDFRVNDVIYNGPEYLLNIEFKAYNDSDVDGVISIELVITRDHRERYGYLIPARQGRHVSLVCPGGEIRGYTIDTHLSRNLPRVWPLVRSRLATTTTDTSQGMKPVDASYFLPEPGKIVVDNMDDNCRVYNDESTRLLTSARFEKNRIRTELQVLNNAWSTYFNRGSYGRYRFTYAAKRAGKGNARVEWETRIPQPGEYELFTYASPVPMMRAPGMSKTYAEKCQRTNAGVIIPPPFNQYYTLSHDEGSEEIVFDFSSLGVGLSGEWISLGRHHLPAGQCKVTLSDKGATDYQLIYADAIKWEAIQGE
jgi:hypothetical protein